MATRKKGQSEGSGGEVPPSTRASAPPPSSEVTALPAPGPGEYDRSQTAEERRREQRERLLDAARVVFNAQGFAGASVDLIIRHVRMSRRTFYEHFRDLPHIFVELHEQGARRLFEAVAQATMKERNPATRVRVGIQAFLEAMQAHAPLARVLYREAYALGPAHAARIADLREQFVRLFMAGFEDAHARGFVRRPPDAVAVYAIAAAIEATALRYLERGEEAKLMEAAPSLIALVLGFALLTDEDIQRLLESVGLSAT